MAKFEIKTDLPITTQLEIDRIEGIVSDARTDEDNAFMTSLAPYLTNEVIAYDSDGLIINARGNTVPDSYPNFAKGAVFIKSNATGNGLYINIGDSTTSLFSLVDENNYSSEVSLTSANILAMNATPVTIVPAVTGKTIVIDEISLKMTTTSTAYANGGALEFRYTDGSGAKVTADIAAGVITAGAGTSYTINKSIVTSLTGVVSSPIIITNATAPFITGTGTGVLSIRYHLI